MRVTLPDSVRLLGSLRESGPSTARKQPSLIMRVNHVDMLAMASLTGNELCVSFVPLRVHLEALRGTAKLGCVGRAEFPLEGTGDSKEQADVMFRRCFTLHKHTTWSRQRSEIRPQEGSSTGELRARVGLGAARVCVMRGD